jgi:hypothetical protein
MHPTIEHQLTQDRIADLHRQAERHRLARAARCTPQTPTGKRKRSFVPGRTTVLARRVLTSLSALRPSPTR